MTENVQVDGGRQRLLERWLPLAQDANLRYNWYLNYPALEALIIAAAPALAQSQNLLTAWTALWQVYHQQTNNEQGTSQEAVAQNETPSQHFHGGRD